MKIRVICPKCLNTTSGVWNNRVSRCDMCNALLDIKDVKLVKEFYPLVLPVGG